MNMYSINGVSYDIYIPSRKIVIEYDGSAWHSNKDTNYKFITASEAGLTLYKISEVFNINEAFSDYSKAYSFAVRQKSNIKSNIITLPDNIQFEWSPLNGYDFNYLSNDGLDKYWRCFYGHTFKRRLDVIKRGYVGCPFCENKQFFDFLYLGSVDNLSIILDVNSLLFSVNYILSMKPTRFRNNFERFFV